MSEFDADLKRLFAQSREEFDGAAFRTDVERRIAEARKQGYAADVALALAIGVAAMVAAPALLNVFEMLTTDVLGVGVAFSATPFGASLIAAAASAAALVAVRT